MYLAFADASPHSDPAQSAVWEKVPERVSVDLEWDHCFSWIDSEMSPAPSTPVGILHFERV